MLQIGDTFQDGGAVFTVKKFGANGALVGSVTWYAGAGTPENYLLCDGSAVSRTDYADLFAVIGTTYGAGDGSTTFNLPLLTDGRFIEGSGTPGTQHGAGLPNITGEIIGAPGGTQAFGETLVQSVKGAFKTYQARQLGVPDSGSIATMYGFDFDASRVTNIYSNSKTVQPQSLTLRPLIKYI